jgi:deoxyribodipyrimidine photo-lyase
LHVMYQLLYRDHCKFSHGEMISLRDGIVAGIDKTWSYSKANFEAWKDGRPGYPFVEACMRELLETGLISDRGRRNVASFLAHGNWVVSSVTLSSLQFISELFLHHGSWSMLSFPLSFRNWCTAAGMTGRNPIYFHVVRQSK